MRYTEVRMSKLAGELLADLDKETVDFGPNYDDSLEEPLVMPSKFPNLVVNGSAGIAVGMATNIPPHNLRETIDACLAIMERGFLTTPELMQIMQGPDFPTGASILGKAEIFSYFETGRGIVRTRSKTHFEQHPKTDRTSIIVDEIPYQVNKAKLIEAMADLVRDKKLEGISDLRDESDRDGMRMVIDLKRDAVPEIVLNQLYKHTALETSFGVILLAIVNGQPKVLAMREMLTHFIAHRKEVVTRRSRYELRKARDRFNVLLGLLAALDNIDRIITIIRGSPNVDTARSTLLAERFVNSKSLDILKTVIDPHIEESLRNGYTTLNEAQVTAILEMRLQRLVGLERDKILDEAQEVRDTIAKLLEILGSDTRLMAVIKEELLYIRETYGDERRTTIDLDVRDLRAEDLIADEDVVVTVTHDGYVKRASTSLYSAQKRGGRGRSGITTKETDFVENIFVASTHSYILVFTNTGRLYWLKVYSIPEGGLNTRGKPIINLVQIETGEKVQALLSVRGFVEGQYVFVATKNGIVKKTDLMAYSNVRAMGIIGCSIDEGDQLIGAVLTTGTSEIFLATKQGMAIRFEEGDVRPMGRSAGGVKGITLEPGDEVVSLDLVRPDSPSYLTVCENGFGKRTDVEEYRNQTRGGKGTISMKTTERNGLVVTALTVNEKEELMISTDQGTMIRLKIGEISTIGRNTAGVRLINVTEGEKVTSVARVAQEDEIPTAVAAAADFPADNTDTPPTDPDSEPEPS